MPALSQATATFLRNLLTSQQIAVGGPDFLEVTERAVAALAELDAVLEESPPFESSGGEPGSTKKTKEGSQDG